ncbi:MAG: hypothetical protein IRZ07_28110, partial [Microbispora sp.]|nr:hypothetical protein [Microbispora sp.]
MAVRWTASGQSFTRSLALGTITQFSITCWVRLVVDRDSYSTPWSVDNGTSDCWVVQTALDGTTLVVLDDGGTSRGSAVTLSTGVWYFVAVAINGSNGTFMVQAETAATPTVSTWSNGSANVNAATLRIGDSPWGGDWWNGNLAAFKLWTGAALSQAELLNEAFTYRPQRTANLKAWYPFVRAETTDYSGQGQTLTGGSGATTEDGPPISWGLGQPLVLLPPAALGTPVDTADTAALTPETATVAADAARADTGTVADTATLGLTTTDTGQLAETATATATPTVGDHATLGETVTLATPLADTAAATEQAALTAALPAADAGALTEEQATLALTAGDQATISEQAELAAPLAAGDTATIGETSHLTTLTTDEAAAGELAALSSATAAGDDATLRDTAQVTRTEGPAVSDVAVLTDTTGLTAAVTTGDVAALGEAALIQQSAGPTAADTATLQETAAVTVTVSRPDDATVAETTVSIRLDLVESDALAEAAATEQTAGPAASDDATLGDTAALAVSATVPEHAAVAEQSGLTANTTAQDIAALAEAATVTTPAEAITTGDAAAIEAELAAVLAAPALTDTVIAA